MTPMVAQRCSARVLGCRRARCSGWMGRCGGAADALVFAGDIGMVVGIVGRDLSAWSVAAVK